ncbi:hypothetical protein K438DRAFT_1911908 [Mycena galopus ATCC 62051]|nr:hypothetical protein K438DRAFT_1911908 [Mycena galopus ATCC 62051]
MSTPAPTMPTRSDRNAPQFDLYKLHKLCRYFGDLEFLFSHSSMTDDIEKKKHATYFTEAKKLYAHFKADVLKLYSRNDENHQFELSDLNMLIGEYSHVGILSLEDLETFYQQFLRITTYLISKRRLSDNEQSRTFLRVAQPASFTWEVKLCLQIKQPDVHPADPYPLTDLYEVAEFALAGGGTFILDRPIPAPVRAPASVPTAIKIKPDLNIAALVGTITEFMRIFAAQKSSNDPSSGAVPPKKCPEGCTYCSDLTHFINDCAKVLEDMQAGKYDLVVSMESSVIRSILPVIDNQQQVECIVDGGSQIIAMSEAVCHKLALSYDPGVVLQMQSANGPYPSKSHIRRAGSPFLTQSIVRNFVNKDQTFTICDLNTGKLATVPTVPRGPPRQRAQGFSNSRN